MFPGEEFLPKVPDPEDIILDEPCDDNNTTVDPTANEDPVTHDHVTGDRTNDDKQESVDPWYFVAYVKKFGVSEMFVNLYSVRNNHIDFNQSLVSCVSSP